MLVVGAGLGPPAESVGATGSPGVVAVAEIAPAVSYHVSCYVMIHDMHHILMMVDMVMEWEVLER